MSDREKVMKALEICTTPVAPSDCASSCFKCPYSTGINTNKLKCIPSLLLDTLTILREEPSTLGIVQNADGIIFTATGDAKQGQERGLVLGKAVMYDHIWHELLYNDLLTKEVNEVLKKVRSELMDWCKEGCGSE